MDKLRIVIAGVGRVGMQAIEILDQHGHDVIAIDKSKERCEEISDAYLSMIIHGDATQPDILEQADLERCDVIAALTHNTELNLGIVLLARQRCDTLRTLIRIANPAGTRYQELVDAVIYPEGLGSVGVANAILGGDVQALQEVVGSLRILQMRVAEGAPLAGKRLEQVSMPKGSLIVSDADGSQVAGAETTLEAGRTYIVAAEPDVTEEVTQLFRG